MPGCWFQWFCFAPHTCTDDATISQFTYLLNDPNTQTTDLKHNHGSWTGSINRCNIKNYSYILVDDILIYYL